MKIQYLNGGLANQVFQYIFYRFAEITLGKGDPTFHIEDPSSKWYLDNAFFYQQNVHNGYELEKVFGLKPNLLSDYFEPELWGQMMRMLKDGKAASLPQLLKDIGLDFTLLAETNNFSFDGKVMHIPANQYFPELVQLPGNFYYHGYWINKNWFNEYKEIFRSELTFPKIDDPINSRYLHKIQNTESVSIHIRRGDFVTVGWAFKPENYKDMVQAMLSAIPELTLFVFSDDPTWCKENYNILGLDLPKETIFVEGNQGINAFRDMQLMSKCKNMINCNSSFCYLAALLNQSLNKIINPTSREI